MLPELEQATLEHPLRESLWAWRMRALHAEGRDAEAPEEISGTLVATCRDVSRR